LAAADSLEARVDGEKKGPTSKEQPAASQPVAAEPTKVGEYCPKLDEVGKFVGALDVSGTAAAAAADATTNAPAIADSANRDWRYIGFLPLKKSY
jgi:hypothetical protein